MSLHKTAEVPCLSIIGEVRITLIRHRQIKDFCIIFMVSGVRLVQGHISCYDCKFWLTASVVIALYSKGGGKNGKHAAVPNVANVASVSYAGFQVFQRMHCQLFRPITSATVAFSTNQYLLMPSTSILCRLSAIPQARNNDIEIHSEDLRIYNTLDESSRQLEAAMKLFAKRGKGKAAQEVEE